LFAEGGLVLVYGEAGAVGGDFEEDAVWLTEVEAAEVVTVYQPAVGNPHSGHALDPGAVLLEGWGTEGDVVDAACAKIGSGETGLDGDVEFGRNAAWSHLVDVN
jgi:hypothetical protein